MEKLLLSHRKAKINLSSKVKEKLKSHLLEATELREGGCHQVDQETERSCAKNPRLYSFFHCLLFLHEKNCDKNKVFLHCYLPFVALWLGQLFFSQIHVAASGEKTVNSVLPWLVYSYESVMLTEKFPE